MQHPLTRHLIHILLVSRRTVPSQAFAKLHKDEEGRDLRHASKSSDQESILEAHVCYPRSNAIADGEAHGISHEDDCHHRLAREVFVAVNAVGD